MKKLYETELLGVKFISDVEDHEALIQWYRDLPEDEVKPMIREVHYASNPPGSQHLFTVRALCAAPFPKTISEIQKRKKEKGYYPGAAMVRLNLSFLAWFHRNKVPDQVEIGGRVGQAVWKPVWEQEAMEGHAVGTEEHVVEVNQFIVKVTSNLIVFGFTDAQVEDYWKGNAHPVLALLRTMPTFFEYNKKGDPAIPEIPDQEMDTFLESIEVAPGILIYLARLYPIARKAGSQHVTTGSRKILSMARAVVARLDRRLPGWKELHKKSFGVSPMATAEQYQIISEEYEKFLAKLTQWARENMLEVYSLTVIAGDYVGTGKGDPLFERAALPSGEEWRSPDAGPE